MGRAWLGEREGQSSLRSLAPAWWERRVAERRGEWAPTGAAFALETGPSLAGEATPSGQWPEDTALSAAHPEAWEGAGGSCVALVTWTQVPARLRPSLTFVPPHLRAQRKDVHVCACVCVCVCLQQTIHFVQIH